MSPDFHNELERVLMIYEEIIGKNASRTRQMIKEYGPITALSKLVMTPDLQSGFRELRDRKQLQYTFEAVIVRFPSNFTATVVEAAQWRLKNANELLK